MLPLLQALKQGNQFNSFTNQSYLGNADLCGYPLSVECGVANTQTQNSSTSRVKIIAGCVGGVVAGMAVAALVCFLILKRTQAGSGREVDVQVFEKGVKISTQELLQATKHYSDGNIIGRGGSCIVYKGVLSNNMVVAVKKLNSLSNPEGHNSFVAELTALGQIRHRNLVKILGTLTTGHFKCLILEYIPNGDLDMHLHKDACNLSWACRFNIALGVAHGLTYLHNETGIGQILHCDLKPSNILLDEDFEPHISDFGIARLITAEKDGCSSGAYFRGSFGYVAPEYAYGEKVTAKGDVYSYGIVLLEMLTGKRPTGEAFAEGAGLALWVQSEFLVNWTDVIDPVLYKETAEERIKQEIYNVLVLALSCVKRAPRDRPVMREVLEALLYVREGKPPRRRVDELICSAANSNTHGFPVCSNMGSVSSSLNPLDSSDYELSSDALLGHL